MRQYSRFDNGSLGDRAYGALSRVNSAASRGVNHVLDSLGLLGRIDRVSSAIQGLLSDPPGSLGYVTNNPLSLRRRSDRTQEPLYIGVCFSRKKKGAGSNKREQGNDTRKKGKLSKKQKRTMARNNDEGRKGPENKAAIKASNLKKFGSKH